MARIYKKKKASLVSGIVGEVVIVNWKGGVYLRSKPKTNKSKRSEAQIRQSAKFRLMYDFLRAMNPYIKIGYHQESKGKTALNAAMSDNLRNAIEENESGFYIDYHKVTLSKGSLGYMENIKALLTTDHNLEILWNDNSNADNAQPTDKAIYIAFGEDYTDYIINTNGNTRSTGRQIIPLPQSLHDKKIHLFISFVSANGKKISMSKYVEIEGGGLN